MPPRGGGDFGAKTKFRFLGSCPKFQEPSSKCRLVWDLDGAIRALLVGWLGAGKVKRVFLVAGGSAGQGLPLEARRWGAWTDGGDEFQDF